MKDDSFYDYLLWFVIFVFYGDVFLVIFVWDLLFGFFMFIGVKNLVIYLVLKISSNMVNISVVFVVV